MNVWKCVRLWCWISQHFCMKVVWYTKQCRKNVNKIMWKCGRWMTAHCQAQTSVLVARFPFWLHCMNFILWKQLICNCYTYFYASLHSKLSEFTSTLDYYYYRWKLVSFSFYSFSIIVYISWYCCFQSRHVCCEYYKNGSNKRVRYPHCCESNLVQIIRLGD